MTALGKYVQHMSSLMELIAISRLTSKCDLLHDSLDTGVREMRADIKASPGKELGTVFLMGETVWIKQWAGSVTWACKGLEWEDPEESGTEESGEWPMQLGRSPVSAQARGARTEMRAASHMTTLVLQR